MTSKVMTGRPGNFTVRAHSPGGMNSYGNSGRIKLNTLLNNNSNINNNIISSTKGNNSNGIGNSGSNSSRDKKLGRTASSGAGGGNRGSGGDLKAIDEMQAMTSGGVIAARASMPSRKTKLRTRVVGENGRVSLTGSLNQQSEVEGMEGVDRRTLSEQILTDGYVQSYVDFFYLTHRPEPSQENIPMGYGSALPEEIDVRPRDMIMIKDNLIAAESARRRGDTSSVYKAYHTLAQHFQDMADPKTGVYFYEKCLEIARFTSDKKGEMSANHKLGVVYVRMGDIAAASRFHERHEELAVEVDSPEDVKLANAELVKMYQQTAELHERSGQFHDAIGFWERSLGAARAAEDRKTEGQACYRLGKAYIELQDAHTALKYLENFESISKELDDLEGQGHAFSALASAYQVLEDDTKAQDFLLLYLEVATKTQNLTAQADACSNLGVLYSRRKDHASAKEMLAQNYSITRKITFAAASSSFGTGGGGGGGMAVSSAAAGSAAGSAGAAGLTGEKTEGEEGLSAKVDMVRAAVGVANAHEMLADYLYAVTSDMKGLLAWKSARVAPPKLTT